MKRGKHHCVVRELHVARELHHATEHIQIELDALTGEVELLSADLV